MNVLLVSHGAALGGSPISLLNTVHHSQQADIHYHCAFASDGPIVSRAQAVAESVEIIPHSRAFFGLMMIIRYLLLIYRNRIDIVHLNTFTSYYKYPAIAASIANRKVIWFVRENPEEKRCLKLKSYANRLADRVVTVSHDTAAHMGYIRPEILTTIHNGVDTDHFSPSFSAAMPDEVIAPYILNISSLEPRKGVHDLIRGYAASRACGQYKLVLLGEDRSKKQSYLDSLRQIIRELDIEQQVIFVSPKQDVRPYIAHAAFIALVSYWEGLSRVLIEATAMGRPILSSRDGGNKEVVTDQFNGLLVDAGAVDQITAALNQMVAEVDLDEMAEHSRKVALQNFSIERNIEKIETLYRSLLQTESSTAEQK